MRRPLRRIGQWSLPRAARLKASPSMSAVVGSTVITAAQVTATLLFALASIYLVRTLSTAEFGRAAFGLNAHALLLTAAGFGLTTGVIAEIARGRGASAVPVDTVHALLVVRIASAAPVVGIGVVWSALTGDAVPAIAAVAASLFLVLHFLIGVLAGELRSRAVAGLVVAHPASYALLLLVVQPHAAEAVLAALIAAMALGLALAIAVLPATTRQVWRRPRLSVAPMAHALWVARYAYVMTFLQTAFFVVPIVVLGSLNRFAEGAALSIMLTLVRFLPEALALMVVSAYFPRVQALPVEGPGRTELFNVIARVVGLVSVAAALGLAILGAPVLDLLFAGRYNHLAGGLAAMSLVVVIWSIEALLTWTLVADGAARVALVASIARLIVVLASSTALLTGAVEVGVVAGLVIVYPVAAALSFVIQFVGARRLRPVQLPLGPMALFGAATGASFLAIDVFIEGSASSPLTIAVAVALCAPLGLLGAWLSVR